MMDMMLGIIIKVADYIVSSSWGM